MGRCDRCVFHGEECRPMPHVLSDINTELHRAAASHDDAAVNQARKAMFSAMEQNMNNADVHKLVTDTMSPAKVFSCFRAIEPEEIRQIKYGAFQMGCQHRLKYLPDHQPPGFNTELYRAGLDDFYHSSWVAGNWRQQQAAMVDRPVGEIGNIAEHPAAIDPRDVGIQSNEDIYNEAMALGAGRYYEPEDDFQESIEAQYFFRRQ